MAVSVLYHSLVLSGHVVPFRVIIIYKGISGGCGEWQDASR